MHAIHDAFPFHAFRMHPSPMPLMHTHTDIELNLFLNGQGVYFLAGRFLPVPVGQLMVFWGGIPHRLASLTSELELLCLTVPLSLFLSWNLETTFVNRLLASAILLEPDADNGAMDVALFDRWARELPKGKSTTTAQKIAALEVEARLRRLALATQSASTPDTREKASPDSVAQVEAVATFLAENYCDSELTLARIAQHIALHPNYLATVFRQSCGIPIWEYLTRLRIAHAQRALIATTDSVERIGFECGFASQTRFFAAFRRVCLTTPLVYRRQGGTAEKTVL